MAGEDGFAGVIDSPDLASIVASAAARWPDDPALVGEIDRLSWTDVERRTRHLAGRLVEHGIGRGDRVAVARPKSNESLEAVHAILRAGAAFVPVDPLAPPSVARQILADAEVAAVIGDVSTIAPLDPWSVNDELRCVIATGRTEDARIIPWDAAVAEDFGGDLPKVHPDDVAYLIYTSGSTGGPKGIVHTHRSGRTYADMAVATYGLRHDDRVAGMCPLHFDMSTLELYAAPLVGACVVVVGEPLMRMFLAEFTELCESERVTVWYTVPYFLRQLTERGALDRYDLSQLRMIMYGGEPYPPGALRELMAAIPHAEYWNVYGPAEVNACTNHVVEEPPADGLATPIGRPWSVADLRIVDESGNDVPDGVAGELLVSATTVMREYWRRPDLTAERLTPRPDGPPWYATGDIVERDPTGVLWFRGRRDHQVKVRGVRLELEAIEAILTDAPGVAHAVACTVGRSGDAASIAAAVVAVDGATVDTNAVRRWCSSRLPSVAVPQHIHVRPGFPSTASGKIDRASVRAELADRART